MKNYTIISYMLILLSITCHHALARPEQMTSSMTTEEPKMTEQSMTMMTTTGSDDGSDEDDSNESGDKDVDAAESSEDDITVNGKSAFTCPMRPGDIENIESQCVAEYKAMKKAKCNMTDEEKMKKMSAIESMENGHSQHMGKREAPEDDMNSNDTITSTMKPMRHRKRSCHYYQCLLKKMDVLDESTMLPSEDMLKTWISNNVTEEGDKAKLQERATECFNDLREAGFYSTDNSKSEEVSAETPTVKKGKTSCGAALKLLKCLSKQDTECPVFKFP